MAGGILKGIRAELKKVVWPTKKQLINNTILVLALVIALAVIILGFDLILKAGDNGIWNFVINKVG